MASKRVLYSTPTQQEIGTSQFERFRLFVNKTRGLKLADYWETHRWSTETSNEYWQAAWDFLGIIGERSASQPLFDESFPIDVPNPHLLNAKLSFTENLLLSHPNARSKTRNAIVSLIEPDPSLVPNSPAWLATTHLHSLTFEELYQQVGQCIELLRELGVEEGDRVVAFSPSNSECVVMCLAVAAIGGMWSSVPAEFGIQAVLERFQQISPKVIISGDRYRYSGKEYAVLPKLNTLLASLPTITTVVMVGHLDLDRKSRIAFQQNDGRKWLHWSENVTDRPRKGKDIVFERFDAMIPLYVLYSSGTTGKPKAIVHAAGTMVLSEKCSNAFHSNLSDKSTYLQFCTLGWMMWNLLVSTLSSGTTVVMYDGSPLAPTSLLWSFVDEYKITCLGISPRYLAVLAAEKYSPRKHHGLSSLSVIATTGSPLKEELYDFIKTEVGEKIFINNASGGTDICGAFVGAMPTLPVYYGEIQVPFLGMKLESWNDAGKSILDDQGNMVITKPFPNLPIAFYNDLDGSKFHSAYFEEFSSTPVWTQGDWIEINSKTGGFTLSGRSDSVLNPQGVRFGTSELYDVVETLSEIVSDSIAVAQKISGGSDERVILFVTPKSTLTPKGEASIRSKIRELLSNRHVPAVIISCPKIPYTTNGKRLEIACKKLVNGIALKDINISSAEDPAALQLFINHPLLRLTDKGEPMQSGKAKL